MNWQPIETAPQRKPIIICDERGHVGEGEVFAISEAGVRPGFKVGDLIAYFARPQDGWGTKIGFGKVKWMPLPEPSTAAN